MSNYLNPHAIRRAMLVKGLTPEGLAFKVGVTPQTIHRLLKGQGSRTATQVRVAQVLAGLPDVVSAVVIDELAEKVG